MSVANGNAYHRFGVILATTLMALGFVACSSSDDSKYVERSADDLYGSATTALEKENYKTAGKLFEEVERQHPYSPLASKSQLMAAYAQYEANEYDDAIASLDRFVRLYPANRDVPYALYLKGLCYYERISDVSRDQKVSEEARQTFGDLVKRYPDSSYGRDAKLKLDLINDHLAGKEMYVGRYYLRQGNFLAAINRFRTVVDEYQTTTHVPEALHRLVEAYMALGLTTEAKKTAAVLGYNYPGSEWYLDAYQLVENRQVRPPEEPWYKFW